MAELRSDLAVSPGLPRDFVGMLNAGRHHPAQDSREAAAMRRWQTSIDRLIVLVIILATWQLGSFLAGPYFLSSPWAVTSRFIAQLLSGLLIEHGSYTIEESLIGVVIGGVPAMLLPFLLRRHPVIVAIFDPF